MTDRENLLTMDYNRLDEYLTAWLDSNYRNEIDVDKAESAYLALYSAGSIERFTGEVIEFNDLSVKELVIDASTFACTLNLAGMARELIGNSNIEELEELVFERDNLECFLSFSSRFAEELLNSGDNELLDVLAKPGSQALQFDILLDDNYPVIGTELSEQLQWFRALLPSDLPRARYWWLYKSEEAALERTVIVFTPDLYSEDINTTQGFAADSSYIINSGKLSSVSNQKKLFIDWQVTQDGFLNFVVSDSKENQFTQKSKLIFFNDDTAIGEVIVESGIGSLKIENPINNLRVKMYL